MPIDNPIEKIRDIGEEGDDSFGDLILAGGAFSPLIALIGVVKVVMDSAEQKARFRAALRGLCDVLQELKDRLPSDVESALRLEWFKRAVQVLIEESVRAPSEERAVLLGRAAGHGCFPGEEDRHRQEDLAIYLRELAQLGTEDVRMLKLLRDVYKEAIRIAPNLNKPDFFTERLESFKRAILELGIHPDDSVAVCARLSGFGLAYEVPRVNTRQSPEDHCFRPTRRGLYLLALLDAARAPRIKEN